MNRLEKFCLAAAILVTVFLSRSNHNIAYRLYADQVSDKDFPIWLTGIAIIYYGPLLIDVAFWRAGKQLHQHVWLSWTLHLLFLPAVIINLNIGHSLMIAVIDFPDFDAAMGGPITPALFVMLFAIIVYVAAVISWIFKPAPADTGQ